MISHGTLPILLPNLTKFLCFCHHKEIEQQSKKSAFSDVSAKCRKCKIGKREGHGKSRNGHGKTFCQVCGTLIVFIDSSERYNVKGLGPKVDVKVLEE